MTDLCVVGRLDKIPAELASPLPPCQHISSKASGPCRPQANIPTPLPAPTRAQRQILPHAQGGKATGASPPCSAWSPQREDTGFFCPAEGSSSVVEPQVLSGCKQRPRGMPSKRSDASRARLFFATRGRTQGSGFKLQRSSCVAGNPCKLQGRSDNGASSSPCRATILTRERPAKPCSLCRLPLGTGSARTASCCPFLLRAWKGNSPLGLGCLSLHGSRGHEPCHTGSVPPSSPSLPATGVDAFEGGDEQGPSPVSHPPLQYPIIAFEMNRPGVSC